MGVLAWITLLPLFGAGLVMLIPREEESIHRPFCRLEKIRGLGRVEPTLPSRDRQLVVERRTEPQETLDGLTQ